MAVPPFVPLVLLGLSICAVWAPHLHVRNVAIAPWIVLFSAASVTALASGVLAWMGLLALGAMLAVSLLAQRAKAVSSGTGFTVLAALCAILLALHVVPGFRNPTIVVGVRLSEDAAPYTQYANFDKGAAGLFLLVFFCRRARTRAEWRTLVASTLRVSAITVPAIASIALLAGYVRLDLKLPEFAFAFLAANLLFTCIAEEAFFRGLLQERLMAATAMRPRLSWLPITVSSLSFGLVHLAGGFSYVLLATAAGLGYALAYLTTRRVEAPVLTHFTVNAVHFFSLTYPSLAR